MQIFLACAGVDLLALMDQTMLATSLYIIGNALGSTAQVSWIASGYFMYVFTPGESRAHSEPMANNLSQHVDRRPAPVRPAVRHLVSKGHPPHGDGHLLLRVPRFVAGPVGASADHLPRLHRYRRRRSDDGGPADCQRRRPSTGKRKVPGHPRTSNHHLAISATWN